jgi:hypothetical protein
MVGLRKISSFLEKLRLWQRGAIVGLCLPIVDLLFYGIFYSIAIIFKFPNGMDGSHNLGMFGDTLVAIQWVVIGVLMIPWLIPMWIANSLSFLFGGPDSAAHWIIISILGFAVNGSIGTFVAILIGKGRTGK